MPQNKPASNRERLWIYHVIIYLKNPRIAPSTKLVTPFNIKRNSERTTIIIYYLVQESAQHSENISSH